MSSSPTMPRSEHPQPMFFRPEWRCLNGTWEFATDRERIGQAEGWSSGERLRDEIVVPFAQEWKLSGYGDRQIHEVVWYARTFDVPAEWLGDERHVLLHFGAVDYRSTVWINGARVGQNEGGHVPFSLEISRFVTAGENRVCVYVEDPLDPHQPRGKQAVAGTASGVHYFNTTGIWQTVWLESVPSRRIEELTLTPRLGNAGENDELSLDILVHGPGYGIEAIVEVFWEEKLVTASHANVSAGHARVDLELAPTHRWTPDTPNLYDVRVSLVSGSDILDQILSYTGFRSIDIVDGQFRLNGQPLYLKMVLDQGYWPDSGLTAPSDEALRLDVELMKRLGFNGARKHQKMEDPRWLYWCDKLGFLVWAEMANAVAWSPAAESRTEAEWARAVRRDRNHPCVIAWVPVNESWGVPGIARGDAAQYAHVERLVRITRQLDPTRPVVDNDGWDHTDSGDIFAIHDYTKDGEALKARYAERIAGGAMQDVSWGGGDKRYLAPGAKYRGQPVVLSEVGGYLTLPEDPNAPLDVLYAHYGHTQAGAELAAQYRQLVHAIGELPFVCGFCYTQLTDVEQETNGLLTYDRRPKVDIEAIAEAHRTMFNDRP